MFENSIQDTIKRLNPVVTKAFINSKMFSRVIVDKGAIVNVMPLITLQKLSKNMEDLISTYMKMVSLMRVAFNALRTLIADLVVGL